MEEVLAPDLVPRIRTLEQEVIEHGGVKTYDSVLRRADGAMRSVIYSKAAMTGDDGRVEGTVTTMVDITERRASEQTALLARAHVEAANRELQTQLSFSHALLDAMPLPISIKSIDGRYTAVNRAWEEFFGQTRQAVLGRSLHDVFGHSTPEEVTSAERDLIAHATHRTLTIEAELRRADGLLRSVIFYKTGFIGQDDSLAGVITIAADITAPKAGNEPARRNQEALS